MSGISRRRLVGLVGRSGGAAAISNTLAAMGLLAPVACTTVDQVAVGPGNGRSVAILGAGIAGLVAAYHLQKAGFHCTLLEARARAGGRVWTLRGGDEIVETNSTQRVNWPVHRDLYFNAGASRIAHHHRAVLSYCREFGVPLEPYIIESHAALVQHDEAFGGTAQPLSRVFADMRGAIAALAARGTDPRRTEIVQLLELFGDLAPDRSYRGSTRAGFVSVPAAGEERGVPYPETLSLDDIAKAATSPFIDRGMTIAEAWNHSPSMLQPVGGMSAIVEAFVRKVGERVIYNAAVVNMRRVGERARIAWRDTASGRQSTMDADFVICTIPLPVLKSIDADFGDAVKRAIAIGADLYVPAVKVAYQSMPRWWEAELGIYGGISWTARDITQMWYPSHGFHGAAGILVGAYIWSSEVGEKYAAMSPDRRIAAAMADAEALHPSIARRVSNGVTVAWSKIPYSLGGWIAWDAQSRANAYEPLLAGDGPFLFAGEHMSYVPGWQEGAVQSAHYTVEQISRRVGARAG